MKKTWILLSSLALASYEMLQAFPRPLQSNHPAIAQTAPDTGNTYIYVSPAGNDNAQGTDDTPFASLQKALEHVRGLRATTDENTLGKVHIILKGGTYTLTETLILTPEDSGTPSSPTLIEAAEGEQPILSGGVSVNGWTPAGTVEGLPQVAQNQVWAAPTPSFGGQPLNFRQLYVNDLKMKRASSFDDLSLSRLVSMDKEKKQLVIPTPRMPLENAEGLEMTIIQDWTINHMRVDHMQTNDKWTTVTFKDPESELEFKRPWPILRADENSVSNHFFYFSNAIGLLNRPQEWYHDSIAGKVYYWPRCGETPENVEVIVPALETLVRIEGTLDDPVSDIYFQGITFEHTTWMRPSYAGEIALQAGQYILDAYSDPSVPAGNVAYLGRPSAGICVKNARSVSFERCQFQHMASTAIDFVSGTKQMHVEGCVFNRVGGTAIQAGFFGDENFEAHQAWNPADPREVCDTVNISNNYIVSPASEDWGCVGIGIGFASNVNIRNNEITDTPYSAISMGWGWNPDASCMHDNHIRNNYIHNFSNQMRDAGAIYTLSSQPNSSITGNRIENVGSPMFNPVMYDMRHSNFDLYTDEGTDYFTVQDNWCERGEISRNKNGNHNSWGINNSSVAEYIKNAAGLETAYQDIKEWAKPTGYAPLDSIAEGNEDEEIDYIADEEGFKLGTAIAVDLNNDNLKDIVYGGGENFQFTQGGVRINKGDYAFVGTQGIKNLYMNNLAAGDLNGDGYMDLVQAGWDFWDSYNAVLLNDGNGKLTAQRISTGKNTSPACGIADINNDGYSDYFFIGNGKDNSFFLQQADRSFSGPESLLALPGGFSDPNMIYADFNNDRNIDICLLSNKDGGVYTRIWYNDGKGNFTEKNVGFNEKGTRGGMAYADINNDGLLDIAVGGYAVGEQWNTTFEQGGKIVTVYLNNGDGTFKTHQEFYEYMFDNVTQPVRFCDWNNDGSYDLIVTGWNMSQGNIPQTDVYLNDGKGNLAKSDINLPGVSESSIELADFTNTGKNDILISGNRTGGYHGWTSDRRLALLCKNQTQESNTPPTAPTNLSATVENGTATLKWDAGSDQETDKKALSYNYYIRDLKTGLYLTFPNADIATGQRRVSQMGNAWMNLGWTLQNLPEGKYAWSVQTVDAGYAGSPFAPEQTFTVEKRGTGIQEAAPTVGNLKIRATDNLLTITAEEAQDITIAAMDGRCIHAERMNAGTTRISIPSGVYVVNNQKILVP